VATVSGHTPHAFPKCRESSPAFADHYEMTSDWCAAIQGEKFELFEMIR
jgi:hypothetical protein